MKSKGPQKEAEKKEGESEMRVLSAKKKKLSKNAKGKYHKSKKFTIRHQ